MTETEYPKKFTLKDLAFFAKLHEGLNSDLIDLWQRYLGSIVGINHPDIQDDSPNEAPHRELQEEFKKCVKLEDYEALGQKVDVDYETLTWGNDLSNEILDKYKSLGFGEGGTRVQ